MVDTALFFSLAFAGSGLPWITLALGDLGVKLILAVLALAPFRAAFWPWRYRSARPGSEAGHPHCVNPISSPADQRLGALHARQRFIEADHEQCFGQGLNFPHRELVLGPFGN